ncbi:Penicillinase repressor [Gimesia maris]|uniref:BlaI/MecI/CopY family transcriptional regulator n=1 Tax=Gimesia maris TaxID=122 RepID=UPI00118BAC13|nr:BlaI/MecI/CopY family transcriptional regulator [Gimesia maris]QDU17333.1 Penicillinase repressor [Gimesia maris]
MKPVSISDAEWQVMNIIWDGQPLAAQEIVSRLSDQADWAPQTIKTMLHRLVKKEVLTFEEQGNRYVYRSRVKRSACVKQASRAFLARVFSSEPAPLLAHFMQHTKLSAEEIAELRRILDDKER